MSNKRNRRLQELEGFYKAVGREGNNWVGKRALEFLSTKDLKLIVYSLRRVRDVLKHTPVEGADYPILLEEHLTQDELDAYRRWKDLEAEVRTGW